MADYDTILTERQAGVLKITLNRPERLNAASIELAEELTAAFYDLGDARAVLITGAGPIGLLAAIIVIVGGLTFLPSLALGPIADQAQVAVGTLL